MCACVHVYVLVHVTAGTCVPWCPYENQRMTSSINPLLVPLQTVFIENYSDQHCFLFIAVSRNYLNDFFIELLSIPPFFIVIIVTFSIIIYSIRPLMPIMII